MYKFSRYLHVATNWIFRFTPPISTFGGYFESHSWQFSHRIFTLAAIGRVLVCHRLNPSHEGGYYVVSSWVESSWKRVLRCPFPWKDDAKLRILSLYDKIFVLAAAKIFWKWEYLTFWEAELMIWEGFCRFEKGFWAQTSVTFAQKPYICTCLYSDILYNKFQRSLRSLVSTEACGFLVSEFQRSLRLLAR